MKIIDYPCFEQTVVAIYMITKESVIDGLQVVS